MFHSEDLMNNNDYEVAVKVSFIFFILYLEKINFLIDCLENHLVQGPFYIISKAHVSTKIRFILGEKISSVLQV